METSESKKDAAVLTWCWAEDNRRGREQADDMVERMRSEQLPIGLGFYVKSLIENGSYDGVAAGFLHRISEHIIFDL